MTDAHRRTALAGLGVVGLGCALRLLWLDADPDYARWQGFVTDEGRWIENARRLHLFGQPLSANSNLHLVIAPLYQAISFAAMSLADLGRASVRFFPAVCGSALVLCFWLALRRRVTPVALLAAALLLATQEDLVMLSRVSVPEMPAMLLEWLAFAALVSAGAHPRTLVLAGALATLAVAMKATTAPFMAVLAFLAWQLEDGSRGARARRLLAFGAVPIGVGILLLLAAVFAGLVSPCDLPRDVATIATFVRPADTYHIAAFVLHAPLAPTAFTWGLAPWFAALVWLANPTAIDRETRGWMLAAAVWTASYIPLAALLAYYPERYQVHALVPLATLVALSVHLLLSARATGSMPAPGTLRRAGFACVLALPPAVVLVAFVVGSASVALPWVDALRFRLAGVALAWLVLTGLFYVRRTGIGLVTTASVAAVITWYVGHRVAGWPLWSPSDDGSWAAQWLIVAAGAAAAVGAGPRWRTRGVVAAAAAAVALASVLPYAGMLTAPAFTLRDASRDLRSLLADRRVIVSDATEGLFIDNRLPYTSQYRLSEPLPSDATLVLLEHADRPSRPVPVGWGERKRYTLNMSSRYPGGPLHVVVLHSETPHD